MRAPKPMIALLLTLGATLATQAQAQATTGYVNLCPTLKTAFCEMKSNTSFASVAVAVDNSSTASAGDVWLVSNEPKGSKLVKFNASGEQIGEITNGDMPSSAKPFEADSLEYAAVDPTDGDVYVSSKDGTVTKFTSSGVFQDQLTGESIAPGAAFQPAGLTVDASGELYVMDGLKTISCGSCANERLDKFGPSGEFLGSMKISLLDPREQDAPYIGFGSIAVGEKGDLYIGMIGGQYNLHSVVRAYSSTGEPLGCPSAGGENILYERHEPYHEQLSVGLAVDSSDGHIFVGENAQEDSKEIGDYSAPCTQAVPIDLGQFTNAYSNTGLAVNDATHELYAATSHGDGTSVEGTHQIFAQVPIPDVVTGAPSGVGRTSAILHGTVNPEGEEVTKCVFEYSGGKGNEGSLPCAQTLPLTGTSTVAVSAELKGLALPPGSPVHVRLRVFDSIGAEANGEELVIHTEPLAVPVVVGEPASGVSQFAATLNGTLETGEAAVSYHFEYGTSTAYGQVAPVPDAYTPITGQPVAVSEPLNELQAGATYHYRLVASSPGGTDVAGPDETFTTVAVPAPSVVTGGASNVGVGTATLSGTIDPHGWDTTYLFEYGMSTVYGSSWPTVEVQMGALEGSQPVVVNVPDLLPGTLYHYRLVATNGGGTAYGPDMTFATGDYPVEPIKEPVALQTLLVPSETGILTTSTQKAKRPKKRRKPRPHHTAKHGRAKKAAGRRR